MTGLSARRLVSAAAVSASALALILPAAASAAPEAIQGQGSTLQEFAQQKVFIPAFNAKGLGTVTKYEGTGSGPGLEAWGNGTTKKEFNVWEYVGTDQPPNPTQKSAIETAAGGAKVLSIPTLQAAVAIIIHLPAGCTSAKSNDTKAKARLVLNNVTLEGIFKHSITKWSQIKDDGDELLPAGCAGESEITRVVREEGSGTTAITKKYFYQVNPGRVDGTKTWNNLAEENKNLDWPEEGVNLLRGHGSGGIVSTVTANAGSIGYVNLANAESTYKGEGTEKFWAFVQKNGTATSGAKYENPEKEGKKHKEGTSNCKGDVYVNGVGAKFPPKHSYEAWNEVSSSPKNKKYALCGFTYDLSLNGFEDIEPAFQPSEGELETIKNYFTFMTGEGQALLDEGTDYEGLPTSGNPEKNVKKIAEEGAAEIS